MICLPSSQAVFESIAARLGNNLRRIATNCSFLRGPIALRLMKRSKNLAMGGHNKRERIAPRREAHCAVYKKKKKKKEGGLGAGAGHPVKG